MKPVKDTLLLQPSSGYLPWAGWRVAFGVNREKSLQPISRLELYASRNDERRPQKREAVTGRGPGRSETRDTGWRNTEELSGTGTGLSKDWAFRGRCTSRLSPNWLQLALWQYQYISSNPPAALPRIVYTTSEQQLNTSRSGIRESTIKSRIREHAMTSVFSALHLYSGLAIVYWQDSIGATRYKPGKWIFKLKPVGTDVNNSRRALSTNLSLPCCQRVSQRICSTPQYLH